jgi:superoxide reductase
MSTQPNIYKCAVCDTLVEVISERGPELLCCGRPMDCLDERTSDRDRDQHQIAIEKTATGIRVRMGEPAHPMRENHRVDWIEVIDAEGRSYRTFLRPGAPPEAEFDLSSANVVARAYCSLHGLWRSEALTPARLAPRKLVPLRCSREQAQAAV